MMCEVLGLLLVLLGIVQAERQLPKRIIRPQFLPSPTNATVTEGETAFLICTIKNLGPKTVVWRRRNDDYPLTIGTEVFAEDDRLRLLHVSQDLETSHWNLVIKNVQPEDEGTYLCQVTSSTQKSRLVTLYVKDVKMKMKGTKYVNMGNQIHLLCNASGISRAPEEIDWFFEGNKIYPSNPQWNGRVEILKHTSIPGRYYISELLIEQSSMADQGSYVCRSSDLNIKSMKVYVLNGIIRPQFLPSPTNVTVTEGETATLICTIRNLGPKTVVWRRRNDDYPLTVGTVVFAEDDRLRLLHVSEYPETNHWNLVIKNVQPEDEGTYLCQVTSSTQMSRLVTLYVEAESFKRPIICGDIDIRNHVSQFQELENCSIIEGSLKIVLLEASPEEYERLHFPSLVEITDYLLIFEVRGLVSLRNIFPNLAVIRGEKLFPVFSETQYALVVFKNLHLEELGLTGLRSIRKGAVRLDQNPRLCSGEVGDWKAITAAVPDDSNIIQGNRNTLECNHRCPVYCDKTTVIDLWCRARLECQTCATPCESGFCNGTICCDINCTGGCTGPSASDCVACKDVMYYGDGIQKPVCVKKCPQGTIKFKHRCIQQSECLNFTDYELTEPLKVVLHEDNETVECVDECPDGYIVDENDSRRCVTCNDKCPEGNPVCSGRLIHSVNDVRTASRCTVIIGSLDIKLGDIQVSQTFLESNLGQIEEVRDYIRIYHSTTLTSLHFLKNLRIIRGERLYQNRFSLVVFNNVNLQELFPNDTVQNLTLVNGTFWFELNSKLCDDQIHHVIGRAGAGGFRNESDMIVESNGFEIPCHVGEIEDFTVLKTSAHLAILSWKPVTLPPMHLISYQIFYKEAPIPDVYSICRSKEICLQELWSVAENYPKDVPTGGEYKAVLPKLKPWTQYAVHVQTRTVSKASERAVSKLLYFQTAVSEPSCPVNLRVSPVSPTVLHVTWDPPLKPNGIVTHYEVYWREKTSVMTSVETRDYCEKPLTVEETALQADSWDCSKETEDIDDIKHRRFFDAVQNEVYVKRVDTLEISERKNGITSYLRTKYEGDQPRVAEKEYVFVTQERRLHIENLDYFQEYVIKVKACQGNKLCSTSSTIIGRTIPDERADEVSNVESRVNMLEFDGKVHIHWDDPPNPNAPIITAEIEYRRRDAVVKPTLICIPYKNYQADDMKNYTLDNLASGEYRYRIRLTSLAGIGPWTDYKPLYVPVLKWRGSKCPVCLSSNITDEELTDLICASAAVFKSIVGRNQEYPAKVKANMRARNKIVIDKFVKYRMANSCECSVLNKEQRALIFTNPANLNTEEELLTLDGNTTIIISTGQRERMVRQLSKSPRDCKK